MTREVYQVLLQGGEHSGKIIAMNREAFRRGIVDMMDDPPEPEFNWVAVRHVPFQEIEYTRSTYRKPYIAVGCPLELQRQYELVWILEETR